MIRPEQRVMQNVVWILDRARMGSAPHRHEVDRQQRLPRHLVIGRQPDGTVILSCIEPLEDARGPHVHLDAGVKDVEARQAREQPARRKRGDRRHPYDHGVLLQFCRRSLKPIENGHRMRQIHAAGTGQHHSPRHALEQADAKVLFQSREPARQCRYRHGDTCTGCGEAAEARRRHKGLEGTGRGEVHR